MKIKDKKPDIRFKEYNNVWEQRKLGDMGKTFTGLSGKTKEDFGHGDAKFITYMNVFTNPIADISMTESVEIDQKQNGVKLGDVFFTTSSETPEEVGMSSVMPENIDNMYLNSFCFGYRPDVKFDLNYLAYVLRAESFRKNMTFLAQGISRYNISKNKVMEVKIPVPKIEEQIKVGEYFRNLDNLITLHQRKVQKLEKIKKSMLVKMFPKQGEKEPEIRFSGFTDAWEQRKLNEISDIVTGTTPSTKDKDNYGGDRMFVSPADIQGNRYVDETITTLTAKGYALGRELRGGTTLFVSIGSTIGKVAQIKESATTNQQINAVIPNKEMDDDFVFTMLENEANKIKKM